MMKISKITSFYHLGYPDCIPENVYDAGSETYVEVGDASSSENNFLLTFSVFICTPAFLMARVSEPNNSFFQHNMIVVNRFDDETIRLALNAHLKELELYADRK